MFPSDRQGVAIPPLPTNTNLDSFFPITVVEKPGSRTGSTQRGCCRNLGESTEDDVFEETARKQRLAKSSKKGQNQNGNEDKSGKENEEEGGNEQVTEQPAASPEMTAAAPTTTTVTKPGADEVK